MRTLAVLTSAAVGLSAVAAMTGPVSAAPPGDGTVPGAWIVVLEDGASPRTVADEHRRRHGADVDHVYEHALRGYAARMSDAAAAKVAEDDRVSSVQRDRFVSIAKPPGKPGGGDGTTAGQTLPTGINRVDGELSSAVSGDQLGDAVDVDVAVIDTGIDTNHPDLHVVGGKNCSTGGSYDDGNGHGSHVAGTIGAKDDSAGVVGVAPGARLWAVRVLDNRGSGTWSAVVCGVDWVTANASTIEVANMSLGGRGNEPAGSGCVTGDALHDAICRSVGAGVTYVVAAGNDSVNAAGFVPAAYDEVITVSALADFDGVPGGGGSATCRSDVDDTFADFSNYGADVDLIAPGVCIGSTWKDGAYKTISGTSMASPHVAGAAALLEVGDAGLAPSDVVAKLVANAKENNVWDGDQGGTAEALVNVDAS